MPFFSTLNLYLSRMFVRYFLLATFGISFLIFAFDAIEMLRRSMGRPNISLDIMLKMIFLKLPTHFQTLLPFIVLLVMLFLTWNLGHFREFVAIQNAGLNRRSVLKGLSFPLFGVGIFYLTCLNPAASLMYERYLDLESDHFKSNVHRISVSENGFWIRETNSDINRIVYIKKFDRSTFHNASFYQFSKEGIYINRWDSPTIELQKGHWMLKNAQKWGSNSIMPYLELKTNLTWAKIQASTMPASSVSFWNLLSMGKLMESAGLSSTAYIVSFANHVMRFFSIWVLSALAIVCMLIPQRHGIRYFSLALILGFAWYIFSDVLQALALVKKINLFLALLLPNLILLLFGGFICLHQRHYTV